MGGPGLRPVALGCPGAPGAVRRARHLPGALCRACLGAGFLGAHALPGIGPLLGIPDGVEVLGLVTVGHPLPEPDRSSAGRGKRPAAEVTHSERWDG